MNDDRPKWLRGTMAVFAGWWSFLICLLICMAILIGLADLLTPGDGLPTWPGAILAVISCVLAILGAVKLVKIQDRFMGRRSRKTNYIVLALLILLTILLMPGPFVYTEF